MGGQEQNGYYERSMRIKATGKTITDHVTLNEEAGEIIYTEPGCNEERVASIQKSPLQLELYRRDRRTKVRVDWDLPHAAGLKAISKMIDFAKEIEETSSSTI